jgi:hypothetical protein
MSGEYSLMSDVDGWVSDEYSLMSDGWVDEWVMSAHSWVSEWVLLGTNSAICKLYNGKNKLIFNEMMMGSALY